MEVAFGFRRLKQQKVGARRGHRKEDNESRNPIQHDGPEEKRAKTQDGRRSRAQVGREGGREEANAR